MWKVIYKEVPATYAFFNKEEARHLIGKKVEFSDDGDLWLIDVLGEIVEGVYPFRHRTMRSYHRFIREILPDKPQEDSKSKLIAIAKEILSQFEEE
jgi:hypothetical protein